MIQLYDILNCLNIIKMHFVVILNLSAPLNTLSLILFFHLHETDFIHAVIMYFLFSILIRICMLMEINQIKKVTKVFDKIIHRFNAISLSQL